MTRTVRGRPVLEKIRDEDMLGIIYLRLSFVALIDCMIPNSLYGIDPQKELVEILSSFFVLVAFKFENLRLGWGRNGESKQINLRSLMKYKL